MTPDSVAYRVRYPIVYLTPQLLCSEESLARRGEAYVIGQVVLLLIVAMCTLGVRVTSWLVSSTLAKTHSGWTNYAGPCGRSLYWSRAVIVAFVFPHLGRFYEKCLWYLRVLCGIRSMGSPL